MLILELAHPLDVAKAEAEALLKKGVLKNSFLFVKAKYSAACERLAFTRNIFEVLFSCRENTLEERLAAYPWNKMYKKDFSLRLKGKFRHSIEELSSIIYHKVRKPKVNLTNPATRITLIKLDKAYCCTHRQALKHDYSARKAHNRPAPHPTSLDPRLSKAIINLTGIKQGALVDPFCGSGGILLEAGMMGLKPVGYDIDYAVLQKAYVNLKEYKVKGFNVEVRDALAIKEKIPYIATDLPYGLNTGEKKPAQLAEKFIHVLGKVLGRRAVIILPGFTGKRQRYGLLFRKNKLRIIHMFRAYVHHSLTRLIYVIEPKKSSNS